MLDIVKLHFIIATNYNLHIDHIDRTNWELENYCRETNNHSPERKLLDNHTANTDPSRF